MRRYGRGRRGMRKSMKRRRVLRRVGRQKVGIRL